MRLKAPWVEKISLTSPLRFLHRKQFTREQCRNKRKVETEYPYLINQLATPMMIIT